MADPNAGQPLKLTPLDALHRELGGKMVPFAGYDMPVQYRLGVRDEHLHTRAKAGLFDVSHMGQVIITGADAAKALEQLVVGDIQALGEGAMRYTLLTNERGGILDDLIVTSRGDHLFVVVNAACKDDDFALINATIGQQVDVSWWPDRALLALQGPEAAAVMKPHAPGALDLTFMNAAEMTVAGIEGCLVSRSGYTGEDGFEISVPAAEAERLARALLADERVEAIGLGARDSLRLEAGLCLYGHDLSQDTTPVEASLTWAIGKRRRAEGGFPGADIILAQLERGVSRKRVGLRPEGRVIAREGTGIADADGSEIGAVTSGGFGPSVEGPVAMGYVATDFAKAGTEVVLVVRGKARPAVVTRMPFVAQRYHK